MAKSQVTEKDLEQSLKTLGGFGNLAGQKPRRDSPFGASFVKGGEKVVPVSATPPPKEAAAAVLLKETVEIISREENRAGEAPIPLTTPVPKKAANKLPDKKETLPKSETLTERITLQMSPEMRDSLNDLARKLQRKKTDKSERITANSVMRVAIQAFLETFELKDSLAPNSEEELLQVLRNGK